jgi:hypothetical protein
MTGNPQEQWKDLISQLQGNLVAIGEDGFRALCAVIGMEYNSIEGTDITSKAIAWIRQLEELDMIGDLQVFGRKNFPNLRWSSSSQEEAIVRFKYYLASGLSVYEMRSKFKIPENRFERIRDDKNIEKADFLIFDLDQPPENWIQLIGANFKQKPNHQNIIFVQNQPGQDSGVPKLDGKSILSLLQKIYPNGFFFNIARNEDDFRNLLSTVEDKLRASIQSDKAIQDQISVQAMTGMRR